jgi:RNA polymerase sigma-70 factor (sigma-E family)
MAETLVADRRGRLTVRSAADVESTLVDVYAAHYRPLVRLATLLLRDQGAAEEVVQDAFVAMFSAWPRLRDRENPLPYLRQAVVNRSRSRLRHLRVVDRHRPQPVPDTASAEYGALQRLDRDAVMRAVHGLPTRQREVLILRYYEDLSEADIAAALGISPGAVKSHASRGIATLRSVLEGSS